VSSGKQSREATIELCPHCGLPVEYISEERRGERVYLYAVHYVRVGRRKRVKKCYLGPADKYEYVERFVKLDLTNILDLDFMRVVERAVENFINAARVTNSKELQKYISVAERMSAKLVELAEKLDSLVGELKRAAGLERAG
jgi:hypothetical protein